MFRSLFRKTTKNVDFELVAPSLGVKVENQNGFKKNATLQDLQEYLNIVIQDAAQFLIVEVQNPYYGIRYVQVARDSVGCMEVQLGLEKDNVTNLVHRLCPDCECRELVNEFFQSTYVKDVAAFTPVEFYQ